MGKSTISMAIFNSYFDVYQMDWIYGDFLHFRSSHPILAFISTKSSRDSGARHAWGHGPMATGKRPGPGKKSVIFPFIVDFPMKMAMYSGFSHENDHL